MATTFAMRLCAFQTFGPRRMPATRMLGPLRPLWGSRFALRQPDAFGAGEYPTRYTNTPLRGYTNFGQLFAIIVAL